MEHIKALEDYIKAQDAREIERNRVINILQDRQAVLVQGINRLAEIANDPMNINPNQGRSGETENPRVNRARMLNHAGPSGHRRRNQETDVIFKKSFIKIFVVLHLSFFSSSNWMWKLKEQTP